MSRALLLLTGGTRSGKSRHAESLAGQHQDVLYLATAPTYPDDPQWTRRIAAHQARRPATWQVRETGEVAAAIREATSEVVLVDCLGLWVTRLADAAGWDSPALPEQVQASTAGLLSAIDDFGGTVILVTNEVGSSVVPAHAAGRVFADLLGRTNAHIASAADTVILLVAGIPVPIKTPPTAAEAR